MQFKEFVYMYGITQGITHTADNGLVKKLDDNGFFMGSTVVCL